MLHLLLHVVVPAGVVSLFFRKGWLYAYVLMMATMLVDIDHLLATPIYDPGRCSIGFSSSASAMVGGSVFGAMLFP